MTSARRVIPSVPLGAEGAQGARRADIVIDGIDQNGPSHELRVFLDNPGADAETEPLPEAGYAGSVHVYAQGGALDGLEGVHVRVPMTRTIIATDAVGRARARGPAASVTLVAVPSESAGPEIDLSSLGVSVMVDE